MHASIFYITEEQIDSSQRLHEDYVYGMLEPVVGLDYVDEVPNISDPDMKDDLQVCLPYESCLRGSRLLLGNKRLTRMSGSDMIVVTSKNTWEYFEQWIKSLNPNKTYFLNQWYDYHI